MTHAISESLMSAGEPPLSDVEIEIVIGQIEAMFLEPHEDEYVPDLKNSVIRP